MKSNSSQHKLIYVDEKWYAAFRDKWYGDFVIEFSYSFDTKDEAKQAVKDKVVYANMPCRFGGK